MHTIQLMYTGISWLIFQQQLTSEPQNFHITDIMCTLTYGMLCPNVDQKLSFLSVKCLTCLCSNQSQHKP